MAMQSAVTSITTTSSINGGLLGSLSINRGLLGSYIGTNHLANTNIAKTNGECALSEGRYKLPDGTVIVIDQQGNHTIIDKDAKVTYKANNVREFNPFINASDLLADFIRDLGSIGVANDKIMRVPLDFYIHWLVVRAAQADGDVVQEHRCLTCGRFLHKDKWRVGACSGEHLFQFKEKRSAA